MLKILVTALSLVAATTTIAASPIAIVNGTEIPRSSLAAAVSSAERYGAPLTPQTRAALRDQLVAEELMWQHARRAGFDSTAATRAAIERARRTAAIEAFVSSRVKPAAPAEQAIRARYEDIVARLGAQEYRLSIIQTPDEPALRAAAVRLAKGADIAAEARRVSRVPSAARGGELDWVSFRQPVRDGDTNGLPTAIAETVVNMQAGQISAPIALGDSVAIVRLDAVRDTLVPDYTAVRDTLRAALIAQSIQAQTRDLLVELMRDAHIRVSE